MRTSGRRRFGRKGGKKEDLRKTTAVLTTRLVTLAIGRETFTQGTATAIRMPSVGSGREGATIGLLQVLVLLGLLVLLALLAGFVAWRVPAPLGVVPALPSLPLPILATRLVIEERCAL
jgi:hypothetical protein